jgi:hypothetical protein
MAHDSSTRSLANPRCSAGRGRRTCGVLFPVRVCHRIPPKSRRAPGPLATARVTSTYSHANPLTHSTVGRKPRSKFVRSQRCFTTPSAVRCRLRGCVKHPQPIQVVTLTHGEAQRRMRQLTDAGVTAYPKNARSHYVLQDGTPLLGQTASRSRSRICFPFFSTTAIIGPAWALSRHLSKRLSVFRGIAQDAPRWQV